MANGIPLAQAQRSALLRSLLQQQQQTRPVTPIGLIGQLGRAFAARQIIKRQEEQQQQEQERNKLATQSIISALQERGQPQTIQQGGFTQQLPSIGDPAQVAGRFADTPIGQAASGQIIQQAIAPQEKQGIFEGTGLTAQAFNILGDVRSGKRNADDPSVVAARQVLERPSTIATPQGTFVQPGFDTEGFLGGKQVGKQEVQQFFPKEPTERERTAAGVSTNIVNAEQNVQGVFKRNPEFDPSKFSEARGNLPLLGNFIASPAFRQYKAGAREHTVGTVFLRSGATARENEITEAFNNLWPQPGDDEDTQTFKEIMRRQQAIEALELGKRANRIAGRDADKQIETLTKELETLRQEFEQPAAPQTVIEPTTVQGIDAAIQDIDRQIEKLRGNGS